MPLAPPYPLFLDLVQRPALVIGGGLVGLRKTRGLIESAARVTVVSPAFASGFDKLKDIELVQAPYAATHMARKLWRLVFAATDSLQVNAQVQKHATAAGILCCRCDEPEEGDFSGGATQRIGATRLSDGRGVDGAANLGGVTVVVSTTGASPKLSARICKQAAAAVDPVLPLLADLSSIWRAMAKTEVTDSAVRRALLLKVASEEMEVVLRRAGVSEAQKLFDKWLQAAQRGDPDFLASGAIFRHQQPEQGAGGVGGG